MARKPSPDFCSTLQMRDQILRAIFKEFFSQLRLLRPVAMLHLAGCGLTKTCAHFLDAHLTLLSCVPCIYASFAERPQWDPPLQVLNFSPGVP